VRSRAAPLAGATAPAAAAAVRRRRPPPAASPLNPIPQIGPRAPLAPPRVLPWPSPAASSPESSSPRRPTAQGPHCKRYFFPRASLQKVNSNSTSAWLKLVNCVENHRKIRKFQTQFCWIRGEISYNFCYSC
jgi:hypothetical protein